MTDRDKGSNERRSLASADEETRERVARKGGQASHGGGGSKSSSGVPGSSSGGTSGGSPGGGSKGSSGGAGYDPEVDRCRDEQGQFTECDDEKGGRAGSSGGSKSGSKGGSSSGGSPGGSRGRD